MTPEYTIGIDFSMNSPAAAILNHQTKSIQYLNVFNTYKVYSGKKDLTRDDYIAKYDSISLLEGVEGIKQVLVREKRTGDKSEDYTVTMARKFEVAERLATVFVDELEEVVGNSPVSVGFESYSYSSRTSSVIDIVEATVMVKKEIWDRLVCVGNMLFIPPQSLKKWATGKGNAPKDMMFDFFVGEQTIYDSPLQRLCEQKKSEILNVKKTKKSSKVEVLSPFDDLIDADVICRYVREAYTKSNTQVNS